MSAACRVVGQVLGKVERQLQAQLQHLLVALLSPQSCGSPLRAHLAPLILQARLRCASQAVPDAKQPDPLPTLGASVRQGPRWCLQSQLPSSRI